MHVKRWPAPCPMLEPQCLTSHEPNQHNSPVLTSHGPSMCMCEGGVCGACVLRGLSGECKMHSANVWPAATFVQYLSWNANFVRKYLTCVLLNHCIQHKYMQHKCNGNTIQQKYKYIQVHQKHRGNVWPNQLTAIGKLSQGDSVAFYGTRKLQSNFNFDIKLTFSGNWH